MDSVEDKERKIEKKRKSRHKKKHIGRKERLRHQLQNLMDEKEDVCHHVTLLNQKNELLKRSVPAFMNIH